MNKLPCKTCLVFPMCRIRFLKLSGDTLHLQHSFAIFTVRSMCEKCILLNNYLMVNKIVNVKVLPKLIKPIMIQISRFRYNRLMKHMLGYIP